MKGSPESLAPFATPLFRIELKRADAAQLVRQDLVLAGAPFVVALGGGAQEMLRQGSALRYPAHSALFTQGEVGDSMFFVLRGVVRLSIVSDAGDRTELGHAHSGETVGEAEMLAPHSKRAFTARVDDGAEVVELQRAALGPILTPAVRELFERVSSKRKAAFDEMRDFLNRW